MKTRKRSTAGFSLVEVTFALGVIVFCLVTILGVLAIGVSSTHVSTIQTSATNTLTAVAADLESTANITPSYPGAKAKGSVVAPAASPPIGKSPVYGIIFPATNAATPAVQTFYIGDNGQVVASASLAIYQLNVWFTPAAPPKNETFARLLITWPAAVNPTTAPGNVQGYVENILAINRT